MSSVQLRTGDGLPHDRQFAFTHKNTQFDFDDPKWITRRNFLVVAHSPPVACLATRVLHESQVLEIQHDKTVYRIDLNRLDGLDECNAFLSDFLSGYQPGPYKLVSTAKGSLTDYPEPAVSLLNLASLAQLEKEFDCRLGVERFRGNVWFDGGEPWEELNWINKHIDINGVILRPIEAIIRCATINTEPFQGVRDHNILSHISKTQGRAVFGVIAEVVTDGVVSIGDPLSVTESAG